MIFRFFIIFLFLLFPHGVKANILPGTIIMQTEGNGELWYFDVLSQKRVYFGDSEKAFQFVKKNSLGIIDNDLIKIPDSINKPIISQNLYKKASGRFLLRIQSKGELWYVNPRDGIRYYIKSPIELYKIANNVAIGMSNKDLIKIPINYQIKIPEKYFSFQETNMRGFNVNSYLSEEDIKTMAEWGVNLIRLNFAFAPLMIKEPPYNFNEEAFLYLEKILNLCEKYNIKVIIDPHNIPGMKNENYMNYDDPFWFDFMYHDLLLKLWREIAWRFRFKNNIIVGYDLLNEPYLPEKQFKDSPSDYNLLIKKLVTEIRIIDKKQKIIIAVPQIKQGKGERDFINRFSAISYFEAPFDKNLVYTSHMYEPQEFTHQFYSNEKISYPGNISGKYWDKQEIERILKPLYDFSLKYKIPVFLGEFSSVRWTGSDGNKYLKDVIDITEKNGWSWAYHSFRESEIWDPEMSNNDKDDKKRYKSTPRLELLKEYFQKN